VATRYEWQLSQHYITAATPFYSDGTINFRWDPASSGGDIEVWYSTAPASGSVVAESYLHLAGTPGQTITVTASPRDIRNVAIQGAGTYMEALIQATSDLNYPAYRIQVYINSSSAPDGVIGYVNKYI
jgi:hypothetical protein